MIVSARTIAAISVAALLSACCSPHTKYSTDALPPGYHWRAVKENGATVFYGIDPTNEWTVYVGPDQEFYSFPADRMAPRFESYRWPPHAAPGA